MRGASLLITVLTGASCLPAWSYARLGSYSKLVAFGDSITDDGAGSVFYREALDINTTYPYPPYVSGYYSNGPPYITYTAAMLDLPLEDYAIGGATAGALPGIIEARPGLPEPVATIPSLVDQVMMFIERDPDEAVSPDALYVLYAGTNDLLHDVEDFNSLGADLVDAIIGNISMAVYALADRGAQSFVLGNMFPLDAIPGIRPAVLGLRSASTQAAFAELVPAYNAVLTVLASELISEGYNVLILDFEAIYEAILLEGAAYNITEVVQPCYNEADGSVCLNPDQHLWFDNVHPTSVVHETLGRLLASEIAV